MKKPFVALTVIMIQEVFLPIIESVMDFLKPRFLPTISYTGKLNFLPCNTLFKVSVWPTTFSLTLRAALTWYNKSRKNPNTAPSE